MVVLSTVVLLLVSLGSFTPLQPSGSSIRARGHTNALPSHLGPGASCELGLSSTQSLISQGVSPGFLTWWWEHFQSPKHKVQGPLRIIS